MPKRVLVVDDEPHTLRAVSELLRNHGLLARTVGSGARALRELRRTVFDLIVLDLRIASANGLAMLRTIRQVGVGTPVLILTGAGTNAGVLEAARLGAEFRERPVDPDELVALARRLTKKVEGKRQKVDGQRLR